MSGTVTIPFKNRREAGDALAAKLAGRITGDNSAVIALPRGGIPVAFPIAERLGLPLDILIVRKLGVPYHRELAMGAIAGGGAQFLNRQLIEELGIGDDEVAAVITEAEAELQRREQLYRGHRQPPAISGSDIILVDDGIATGATVLVAIEALRRQGAASVTVAVPVLAASTLPRLEEQADRVIYLYCPAMFGAVGNFYRDFSQTTDEEVCLLLDQAATASGGNPQT